ncbi:MAG: 5'-3' exonuclease [Aquificae bacterium]|nr:5'-3' exonuclease [Aquificota bacterium]
MKTLHLIDASSFIYRSFFALPPLSTKDGFPTGAIYGFLRALLALMKSEKPQYLAVVFDYPAPSKREKVYKEYKAGRPSMPDPLKLQIPVIKEILKLMGIPIVEMEGYEADDLIAVLAKEFYEKGFNVKIYTPDKDMLQLVNDRIAVINPMSWEVFNREKVIKKFGVPPEKVADYLALVGDSVDNIKGIRGVGPKTAVKLIEEFGGVKGILENWERFKEKFPQAQKEELELSYYLVSPLTQAQVNLTEEDLKLKPPKMKELKNKLENLEMKSILREIDKVLATQSQGSLF